MSTAVASAPRRGTAAPVPGTLAAFGFVNVPATAASSSSSSLPLLSASGRPSRNVVRPNYAEASDESLGGHNNKGSGRKRRANTSASPAAVRRDHSTARPKFLLRMLNDSATPSTASKRKGAKQQRGSDDEEESEEDEDEEEQVVEVTVKSKSKAVQSLNFGSAQKVSARVAVGNGSGVATAKYVTRLLIACEEICCSGSEGKKLLPSFHAAMQKLLPLNPANLGGIVAAMERVFDTVSLEGDDKPSTAGARIVQRIQTQLKAIGPEGQPIDRHLLKQARTPMLYTCSGCKRSDSFLSTICSSCKKHSTAAGNNNTQLTPVPYLDWRKVVLKQRQLDAADAKSESKKKGDASPSSSSSTGSASPEPSDPTAVAPASPNKRAKASPTSSPASAKASLAASSSTDLSDIAPPSAEWIEQAREALSCRAIQWIGNFMMKCPKENFAFSGGDIIFLLRNAIFKGQGEVAKQANDVVSAMLGRWDSSTCTIISDNSEPAHVLVYAECLHAKMEMEWCKQPGEFQELVRRLRSAVASHCSEDILRFDATRYVHELPKAPYCKPCGQFRPGMNGGLCPDPECLGRDASGNGARLRLEDDYEHLTESLVWTSLFRELGIDPVPCADASVRFEHMLGLIKVMRPYRSLDERGPRALFVEEYLFLLSNMDVCIAMQDAELVGELLQALHILDTPHSHPAMQKGYHFLLGAEKQGKMRGNWVQTSASFYQKYHAAYTGIIGLAEFKFDPNSHFPKEWAQYFK